MVAYRSPKPLVRVQIFNSCHIRADKALAYEHAGESGLPSGSAGGSENVLPLSQKQQDGGTRVALM